ncbi:MAG: glycosyltransferase [Candidatus Stahlbacteria bacterium]|nr:glycosyltransferase [Candidatus Stahlbacteria bacterium]
MKVAYVSTYLPQHCGIATYTDYLIQGIRQVSTETNIKILAERSLTSGAKPVKEEKFEVIPCWERDENYIPSIVENTKDADVVHIQHEYGIYKFDNRLPEVIRQIQALKVITMHCIRPSQFSPRDAVDENTTKTLAQLADSIIVHLPSQEAILRRLGIAASKIQIIPHGTEINNVDKKLSREKLGLPLDGNIMLMFGFIKRHKCMDCAVEALKEIENSSSRGSRVFKGGGVSPLPLIDNTYLLVAGGVAENQTIRESDNQTIKEYVEQVKTRIKELGLDSRVIFYNKFIPNNIVPYLFGAADIVLFPYYEEDRSASGSLHLAIGANKPIIASRIPKFEELQNICDELLILPHNAIGIARVANRIFNDNEFRQYVTRCTEDYRNKTAWQTIAKQHLNLYTQLQLTKTSLFLA